MYVNPSLHNNAFLTPLKYHVVENIMKNEAFAHLSKCSIFLNIFNNIQNLTYFFLEYFQCCLKRENDVMI